MTAHLFQRIAKGLPVKALNAALDANPELWREITARQEAPGSAHHSTEAIFLRWCRARTVDAAHNAMDVAVYPASGVLLGAISPLFEEVLARVQHVFIGRVMIANLKAGCSIDAHIDEGRYADHYDRFHVALQSDAGNLFYVDGKSFHAKPGELWWFNHKREHRVENNSTRDRWHLIVDLVAPTYRRTA